MKTDRIEMKSMMLPLGVGAVVASPALAVEAGVTPDAAVGHGTADPALGGD